MEKGHILTTNHNILFIGFSGSGKTHTMCLMQGKPPPQERSSTPCAERPVRAVTTSRAKDEGNVWRPVSQVEHSHIVVEAAVANPTLESVPTRVQPANVPQQSVLNDSQMSPSATTSHQPHPPKLTSSQASAASSLPVVDIREDMAERMDQCILSPPLKQVNWVNLVDSGGSHSFTKYYPRSSENGLPVFLYRSSLSPLTIVRWWSFTPTVS